MLENRLVCHLPDYRQSEIFARLGVKLHRKTLCDWALLASDWLAHLNPIEKRLRETHASTVLCETIRAWQSRPSHQRLKKLFAQMALRRAILPKSLLGKAISYALNPRPKLQTYLAHGSVENCRCLGINLRDYFEDALTRLPAMLASEAVTLTPANGFKACSRKAGRAAD